MALETFPKPACILEHWRLPVSLSSPQQISLKIWLQLAPSSPQKKCTCANMIQPECQAFTESLKPTQRVIDLVWGQF